MIQTDTPPIAHDNHSEADINIVKDFIEKGMMREATFKANELKIPLTEFPELIADIDKSSCGTH